MKASLLLVMAASMIIGTALNAQTNPRIPPRPPAATMLPPPGTKTITSQQRFNLNGVWKSPTSKDPSGVRFEQQGNTLRLYLGGAQPAPSDILGFEGQYVDNTTVTGRALIGTKPPEWAQSKLIIDDPDHVHFEGDTGLFRDSLPQASDAICNATNSSHTQGLYADIRGEDAERHNDIATAACWYRTGALQNNSRAEGEYARLLESGKTGTRDYPQALAWAKKAADQHLIIAALLLQHMYAFGEGVPVNLQMARHWRDEAQQFQREGKMSAAMADPEIRQGVNQVFGSVLDLLKAGADTANDTGPHKYKDLRDVNNPADCEVSGGSWDYSHPEYEYRQHCWPK
jgi:hypothetical protein